MDISFGTLNSVLVMYFKRIADLDPAPCQRTFPRLQYIIWVFSFVKTCEPAKKTTGGKVYFT